MDTTCKTFPADATASGPLSCMVCRDPRGPPLSFAQIARPSIASPRETLLPYGHSFNAHTHTHFTCTSRVAILMCVRALIHLQIFTPDDTHFEIALYAVQKGLHVLLTKPPVKTVREQQVLIEEARKHDVLVTIDYHKRWDPIYVGAWRDFREQRRGAR